MRVAQPIKILLLGANGQLGRALMAQPLWRQFATVALSHQQLDITNTAVLAELFSLHSPDVVINCAAFTGVDQAEQQAEQCYAVNTAAVHQLAQLCQRYCSLFIQFSTDYVFSGSSTIAYSETDEP
ncbi:MAG TPA: sugar nucleotide-binding protein, partial [Rheinheimera sp.]|nr:sugar nucleotide-binding protein [Rheinheimera sp.]